MDHQKDPSKLSAVQEADLFLVSMEKLERWARARISASRGKKRVLLQTALAGMYGQLQFLLIVSEKDLNNVSIQKTTGQTHSHNLVQTE